MIRTAVSRRLLAGFRHKKEVAAAPQLFANLFANLSTIPEPDDTHLYAEQLQTPNFVHAVNISQLDTLVRQPSLPLLVNSATFLKSQLPARLENHIYRLKSLPTPRSSALAGLLSSTVASKQRGLEVAKDWKLVDAGDAAGLHHFDAHLAEFREHLEVEVMRLTAAAKELTEQQGWWDDAQQVRWLNRMLDLCHWYLLSARVMLTQHSAALYALQQQGTSTSTSSSQGVAAAATSSRESKVEHYHEPGHRSTAPDQPYNPPHQQLSAEVQSLSLIQRRAPLGRLLSHIVEDCRAFCVEKNSAAPDVQTEGADNITATLVVPYVEFVLTEVLKNALQAVIKRYGAWEVDDAPPVTVKLTELVGTANPGSSGPTSPADQLQAGPGTSSKVGSIRISITDMGNGIPPGQMENMFSYFYSSNQPASTLYGYSRNHGSQFQGQGVGVPMARVYAHFMGGSIEWETDAWRRHTTVTFTLPKHGFTF